MNLKTWKYVKWIFAVLLLAIVVNFTVNTFLAPALTFSAVAQLSDDTPAYIIGQAIASGRLLQVYNGITIVVIMWFLAKIASNLDKKGDK